MVTVVSFGGGVNSTAMLLELCDRKDRVDLILFADTGGEKPETYEFVSFFSNFLHSKGMPEIITVRDERRTLEEECLEAHTLPSIVVGARSCSDKYKIRPQSRFLAQWEPAIRAWESGEKITKLVGFDAGEAHRVKNFDDKRFNVRYPLVEWNWGRDECLEKINGAGIVPPPKSSCFFCPEMREHEVIALRKAHPVLFDRAIAMERGNTSIYAVEGLARKYSWAQIADYHDRQMRLPIVGGSLPCMCFDGECTIDVTPKQLIKMLQRNRGREPCKHAKLDPHTCPYLVNVLNDKRTKCRCCGDCEKACAAEI